MRIAKSGIKFDHGFGKNRWDKYQEHYNYLCVDGLGYPQFDLFENGSIGFTAHSPDPHWRMHIAPLGVTIFASDKLPMPLYLADGTQVPMAWLHYEGIQNLLLDYDRGVVVGTQRTSGDKKRSEVPRNKASACAVYWAHEDSMPVGSPVAIYRPMKPTKEIEEAYDAIKPIAKAICALEGIRRYGNTKVELSKIEKIARDGLDSIDKHLSRSDIAMIADSTFAAAIKRSREEVQYLYTNDRGEIK